MSLQKNFEKPRLEFAGPRLKHQGQLRKYINGIDT
jgi:hypothetical protein